MSNPSPTEFINSQWLIPQQPGMKCRDPSISLAMLFIYNLISVTVSTLLATSFFYRPFKRTIDKSCNAIYRYFREVLLRKPRLEQQEAVPEGYTKASLWCTILGSVIISLLAPILTAITLRAQNGQSPVQVGGLIQQWATRPRPTIFLAVLQFILAYRSAGSPDMRGVDHLSDPENSYYTTILSALLNEIVLSAVGLNYLVVQAKTSREHWLSAAEIYALENCPYVYGCVLKNGRRTPLMQSGAVVTIVFIVLGYFFWVFCVLPALIDAGEGGKRVSVIRLHGGIGCWMYVIGLWVLLVYVGSWILWGGFLTLVPKEMYCVEENTYVDVIYCLLPFVLGLWRLTWAARGTS